MRERPHRKMLKKLLLLLWLPFFVSLVSFSNFSESAGVAFRNLSACAFHRSQNSCDKRSKMSVPVSAWRICGPDGAKVLATSNDAWLGEWCKYVPTCLKCSCANEWNSADTNGQKWSIKIKQVYGWVLFLQMSGSLGQTYSRKSLVFQMPIQQHPSQRVAWYTALPAAPLLWEAFLQCCSSIKQSDFAQFPLAHCAIRFRKDMKRLTHLVSGKCKAHAASQFTSIDTWIRIR